jgi:hypothetical protein
MRTMHQFLMLFLAGLIISCGGGMNEDSMSGEAMVNYDEITELENQDSPIAIDRKLIKTGYLTYEVSDIHATEKKIRKKTLGLGGYVTNENQFEGRGRLNYSLELKVPNSKFGELMASISEGVEEFDERSVDVQDVTEEFIDVEARLKTKKEVESKYLALLEKTVSIDEILRVENELKYIREEIESIEGRLKYLRSSVAFSTIHVTFYENIPIAQRYGEKFETSFLDGWKYFVHFLILMTYLWPYYIIAAVVILIIKRRRKIKLASKAK